MPKAPMSKGRLARLRRTSPEVARALPSSKGGETPFDLQSAHTEMSTYFTRADNETHILYSADRWVIIRLVLESAGPVDVGEAATLHPVLSGKGRSLVTGVEFQTTLAKGTRIYVTSQTVNRVLVTIEPIPWLSQISQQLQAGFDALVAAVKSLHPKAIAKESDLPDCPPPRRFKNPLRKR